MFSLSVLVLTNNSTIFQLNTRIEILIVDKTYAIYN